jgi:UDP-N-acetylmuramate--alanine ligase
VRASLETAREHFTGGRLWCIFQPHQVSRTRTLLAGFAESLAIAHDVLVAPVFSVRETADIETHPLAAELARRITAAGGRARFYADLDRIAATLEDETRPGDVVLTMGAGDIDRVHHDLTGRLQRHLAS